MKIIKAGMLIDDFKMRIKCELVSDKYGFAWDIDKFHCGSILEIGKDDIEYHHWSKYLVDFEGEDYLVTCPVCGCKIYIPDNKLSEQVKYYAKTKNSFGEK